MIGSSDISFSSSRTGPRIAGGGGAGRPFRMRRRARRAPGNAMYSSAQVTAIGVNSYLWRATLETLSLSCR